MFLLLLKPLAPIIKCSKDTGDFLKSIRIYSDFQRILIRAFQEKRTRSLGSDLPFLKLSVVYGESKLEKKQDFVKIVQLR